MTLGLRSALIAFVIGASVFGLLIGVAIRDLDHQVNQWWAIERVDEARQNLFAAVRHYEDETHSEQIGQVEQASSALAAAIQDLSVFPKSGAFVETASRLTQSVRTHFAEARTQHDRSTEAIRVLNTGLGHLRNIIGMQMAASAAVTAESARTDGQLERRRSEIATRLQSLFDLVIAVQRVNQQIKSFARFDTSKTGLAVAPSNFTIDTEDLPPVCSPEQVQDPEIVCDPSPTRLRQALGALASAQGTALTGAAQQALQAGDAYVRTASRKYETLRQELERLDETAREERATARNRRVREIGLARVNRTLLDVQVLVDRLSNHAVRDFSKVDGQMQGRLAQLRTRGVGVMEFSIGGPEASGRIRSLVEGMENHWNTALSATMAEESSLRRFQQDLDLLGIEITKKTLRVREAAGRWIDIFASSSLGILTLVSAVVLGAAAAAYVWITRPLALMTQAILDLAEGVPATPFRSPGGGQAIGKLFDAIERLRQANFERLRLMESNAAQRSRIETQMRTLEARKKEIEHQAHHDALTGLPNRRYLDAHLPELESRAHEQQTDFVLLHIDLDRFKQINDTIGHAAGDFTLCHAARVLTEEIGPEGLVFRIGGDEFLITLEDHDKDSHRPAEIADRVVSRLNDPIDFEGHACRIGASIGIAHGSTANLDSRATLMNADMALYRAKTEGRNRYVFFSKDILNQVVKTKELSDQLFLAIEREEFVPVYQPQFYAGSLELRGLETLCRWQHPELGLLSPAAFLATAEEIHLSGQIDRMLVEKTGADLRRMGEQGCTIPKISFNVTAERLLHHDLPEQMRAALGPTVGIGVELLESMSLDTLSEPLRWAIASLQENGFAIEIDDFGSCRASIAGLISVEPDAMKIDRSIVAPIVQSSQHLRMVQAIVEIGETLNIEVVAEGVETPAHVERLQELGCSVLQGYALAHPMTADDLIRFLKGGGPKTSLAA